MAKMENIPKQEFTLSNGFIWLCRFGVVFFVGMAIMSLSLPFLPDENGTRDEDAILIISALLFIVFLGFSIWSVKTVRYLPFRNITADTEGLWYSHLSKENGLITWLTIVDIKERPTLQRLDLIGEDGLPLMKVEYQLSGFENLRVLLGKKVLVKNRISLPATFSSGVLTHYFNIGAILGFSYLGWYVATEENNPLIGYGGMSILVGLILYEYLTMVWKLELLQSGLVVRFPLSSRTVGYDEISSIELNDTFHKGVRHPEVLVNILGNKKLKLKGLKVDSTELYAILKKVTGGNNAI